MIEWKSIEFHEFLDINTIDEEKSYHANFGSLSQTHSNNIEKNSTKIIRFVVDSVIQVYSFYLSFKVCRVVVVSFSSSQIIELKCLLLCVRIIFLVSFNFLHTLWVNENLIEKYENDSFFRFFVALSSWINRLSTSFFLCVFIFVRFFSSSTSTIPSSERVLLSLILNLKF